MLPDFMEVSKNNAKEVCPLPWSRKKAGSSAANPGFASGAELSNIKILTDGGEHMEGCDLHNPATLTAAEPREGCCCPPTSLACLQPHPAFRGLGVGEVVISGGEGEEKKKEKGASVRPCPILSGAPWWGRRRRPTGRGKAQRTFRGERDVLPRSLGCQVVGLTPWAPLPPWLQGAGLSQSPKLATGGGSRRGRAGRARGRGRGAASARGGAVGSVARRLGRRCTSELRQPLQALLLQLGESRRARTHRPGGPAPRSPPPGCLCTSAPEPGAVLGGRASSLMAPGGRPNPGGIRLRVLEKFRGGREGWESPLPALGGAGRPQLAASSRPPPSSLPGPAIGVAASGHGARERAMLRRWPRGGHAPPALAAPGGCPSARPAPSAPGPLPPPGPPQGPEPPSPGLGSAHARRSGQPPAPGAARSWGPADAARPALPCGLPSACCCEGGGAHSRWKQLKKGGSPRIERGRGRFKGWTSPLCPPLFFCQLV